MVRPSRPDWGFAAVDLALSSILIEHPFELLIDFGGTPTFGARGAPVPMDFERFPSGGQPVGYGGCPFVGDDGTVPVRCADRCTDNREDQRT